MGCSSIGSCKPPPQPPELLRALTPSELNPKVPFRPRHHLLGHPLEDKQQEIASIAARIGKKLITFEHGNAQLSDHAMQVLQNIADALQDYPELSITVQGYATHSELFQGGKQPRKQTTVHREAARSSLALARAEACRDTLLALGVVCQVQAVASEECSANSGSDEEACLWQRPCVRMYAPCRPEALTLLEPQQRLDLLLSKHSFAFPLEGIDLPAEGLCLASRCVRVLSETPCSRLLIIYPKGSSRLVEQRANSVGQALVQLGAPCQVEVRQALGEQGKTTFSILPQLASQSPTGAVEKVASSLQRSPPSPRKPQQLKSDAIFSVDDMMGLIQACSISPMEHACIRCEGQSRLSEAALTGTQFVVDWFQANIPSSAEGRSYVFGEVLPWSDEDNCDDACAERDFSRLRPVSVVV